jgi:glycosyltransferase involved in cell wall biosynthesis
MRILQVIPYFFPAEAYGGPVQSSNHLSKELVRRGHQVIVYTTDAMNSSTRQKVRYLEMEGRKVHYFRNLSNNLAWHGLFLAPAMVFQLRKEIGTFDVIHLQDYRNFQNIVVHHYAKKCGVPYVVQARGELVTFFQRGRLKKVFDRLWGCKILKDASRAIAVTPTEVEQYKSMGVSQDKIEIVPNGIDLSEFDDLPQRGEFRVKYDLEANQKVILYLGRINWIKGLDLLASAFADISKSSNDVKLAIVGPDGGYLPALKKLIKELGIEGKVLFTGPLYGRHKLEAYVDADVYVLPSLYEIFGITLLEALACGTPVIVTDRCGIASIIDGQAGLVTPCDKEQLAGTLSHMLSDDRMRREFGERGKLLVREKFNWEIIAEQIENIYRAVF